MRRTGPIAGAVSRAAQIRGEGLMSAHPSRYDLLDRQARCTPERRLAASQIPTDQELAAVLAANFAAPCRPGFRHSS
jgi:hypothetical protein